MFNYLSKDALLQGQAVIVLQSPVAIPSYKEIRNQGELVEYEGDIPSRWEYDAIEDVLYNADDKPSSYHRLKGSKWVVIDTEGFKKAYMEKIEEIKAEILAYGYDHNGHQQRCREKDIIYMIATIVMMLITKIVLGKEKKARWYFEDNSSVVMNLTDMANLMMFGGTFTQSVYDTENYFKTLDRDTFITQEEFEEKRKEIHQQLVGGDD